MEDKFLHLVKRFIADDHLSLQELRALKKWLESPENQLIIERWTREKWNQAPEIESEVTFDMLVARIEEQYQSEKAEPIGARNLFRKFQKVAAILLFPVIIFSGYLVFKDLSINVQYAEAIVAKGQKSEIVLPDNTHIWLNSGTKLRYPTQFGTTIREVFLEGEAYFEVSKNKHKPFVVHTSDLDVKVLGTKFNVKAYSDENEIQTALLEGKVNLIIHSELGKTKELAINPGEMFNYSKTRLKVEKSGFKTDEIVGWKNNRLVFIDDTFDNLVKKIERWYNVEIIYDRTLYKNQRLTVELLEGESLERLFQIIERTINVEYRIDRQKIYINPIKKNN